MDKVIREKLYRTRNDVNLTKMITDYVGNTCDKCFTIINPVPNLHKIFK